MRIAVEGADLDISDDGRGKAIVLLHAFALSKRIWIAQAAKLVTRARVVAIDLRGMGASSAPPGPYLTESLASDVLGVLDALGIKTATIVGHSYSVGIALEFYRMFAERVAALGLFCGTAAAIEPRTAAGYAAAADAIEGEGTAAVLAACGERYVSETTHREGREVWQHVRELLLATPVAGAAATLRGMALRGHSEDLLAEIGVPVVVVAGRQDALTPLHAMRGMAQALPSATFTTLGSGHVPSLEAPDATTALLEGLLERVPALDSAEEF